MSSRSFLIRTSLLVFCSIFSTHFASAASVELPNDEEALTRREMVLLLQQRYPLQPLSLSWIEGEVERDTLFFPDVWPAEDLYKTTSVLCHEQVLDCGEGKKFQGESPATREGMLKLYYALRYQEKGFRFIPEKYHHTEEVVWHAPYVYEAIRENLFTKETAFGAVSHRDFLEFLRRDDIHGFFQREVPYFHGLEKDLSTITGAMYPKKEQVEYIISEYYLHAGEIDSEEVRLLYNGRLEKFQELLEELKREPLQGDPSYTEEWKQRFREAEIREKLGYGEYKFKTNAAYRKKNILAALNKMNGLVLQPGEEFDYWGVLDEAGYEGIGGGWTLQGNKEVWAWGGGLCGSATALFRAAWFSGLEITERRPHSVYTTGFYAMSDIGLDASVFLTKPNLRFKNTTNKPVMLYLNYREEPGYGIAQIQVLGTKHYTDMQFPALKKGGGYYTRERIMTLLDGSQKTEEIKSSYSRIH